MHNTILPSCLRGMNNRSQSTLLGGLLALTAVGVGVEAWRGTVLRSELSASRLSADTAERLRM
jgi:hypothetical protein